MKNHQLELLQNQLKQLKQDLGRAEKNLIVNRFTDLYIYSKRRCNQLKNDIQLTESRIYNLKRITNVSQRR